MFVVQLVRWTFSAFLCLLGLFFLIQVPLLLFGWMAAEVPWTSTRLSHNVTLGLLYLVLALGCFASAALLVWFLRRHKHYDEAA